MIGNKSQIRLLKNGAYVQIGSLTEIGELQRTREEVDTTDYDSNAVQTQLTLEDNGEISLMFNYNPSDSTQTDFETSFAENTVEDWEFYLNDENGTTLRFKAAIKSFSLTVPNVENVTISASLRVSGGFTKVFPSKGSMTFTNTTNTDIVIPVRTITSKTVSGVKFEFRTVTRAIAPANGTVNVAVIGMNPGTGGNLSANTSMVDTLTGITSKTQTALTGGTNA